MGENWVQQHGGSKSQNIRARTAHYQALKSSGRALRGSDADDNYDNNNPFYVSSAILDNLPTPHYEGQQEEIASSEHRRLNYPRTEYDNSTKIQLVLSQGFALSQAWRCAWKNNIIKESENPGEREKDGFWFDCDAGYKDSEQVNVMGYSVRSKDFRYTAYLHFDRKMQVPIWELPPYSEELYDHRADTTADLGHRELVNVAKRPGMEQLTNSMKTNLINYLRHHVQYQSQIHEKKHK